MTTEEMEKLMSCYRERVALRNENVWLKRLLESAEQAIMAEYRLRFPYKAKP